MDTVVFEAPVLAHKDRLIGQPWQLRYCKLRRNGQLHVSSSDRSGQLSFTMDLKLLPTSMIRAGRTAIRTICPETTNSPFPQDEFVELQHDITVRIDWAVVLMDARHKGRFYPLAFTNSKHFIRFLKQLKFLRIYQTPLDDLILKAAIAESGTGGRISLFNSDALAAWMHIAWRNSTKCIRTQEQQHSEGGTSKDDETEALEQTETVGVVGSSSSSYAKAAQQLAALRQQKK